MRITIAPALGLLALTACQQPASSPDGEPSQTVQPSQVAPTNEPIVAAPSSPAPATAIPERFRGVWDYANGSCMPSSDLRLEIGADRIEFYESVGEVTGITIDSPDSVIVGLAMQGEGETWTTRMRYSLSDDGATLTPERLDDAAGQPMPRTRCPA